MSDQAKLAEAMLKLAEAINALAAKLPQAGLGGSFTIYHQHAPIPAPSFYQSPYYGPGGAGMTWGGGGGTQQ